MIIDEAALEIPNTGAGLSYFSLVDEYSVKIDDIDVLAPMTLTDVSVNMTALFHLGGAVWALNPRLFAAFELSVPLQVPRVHIALQALRTSVSLDVVLHVSISASPRRRLERLLFVVKILEFL